MNPTATWQRVSRRRPCPVCERPDWCLYVGLVDSPTAAICARVESPKRCGEAGWLHELRSDGPTWAPWRRTISRAVRLLAEVRGGPDLAAMVARWRLPEDSPRLRRLATALGLSPASLHRLAAGWSPDRRCWSFPMTDAAGQVIGIRLRGDNGRKLAVRAGHEALFIPSGLTAGGRLSITEGPSDCAALLDWGFSAVGRPSCTGGAKHLCELAKRLQPADVVVVADNDPPDARGQRAGLTGAERLAATLVAYCPAVRVITPPPGTKDARQWKQVGGKAADVVAAIDAAPVRKLRVSVRKRKVRPDAKRS